MISYESKLCVMQNICLTRPVVAATHSRHRAPHRTLAAVAAATVAAAAGRF